MTLLNKLREVTGDDDQQFQRTYSAMADIRTACLCTRRRTLTPVMVSNMNLDAQAVKALTTNGLLRWRGYGLQPTQKLFDFVESINSTNRRSKK